MKVFCRVEHWFFILANAEQPLFFVPNFLVLQKIHINFFLSTDFHLSTIFHSGVSTHSHRHIFQKKKIIIIIPTISTDFDIEPL